MFAFWEIPFYFCNAPTAPSFYYQSPTKLPPFLKNCFVVRRR